MSTGQLELSVHFLPQLVPGAQLAGATCAVIDVLRATTTIAQALAAGAREVLACLEVNDALTLAALRPRDRCVLGGERGGLRIDGFDLGNSPAEYVPAVVGGKTVIFTTTNGTRAVLHCRRAKRILLASFANLAAVCRGLQSSPLVHVVCAGTAGQITREDVLAAGAIVEQVGQSAAVRLNDQAAIARDAWRAIAGRPGELAATLAAELRHTKGGRNLQSIDLAADIDWSAELDRLSLVPQVVDFLADPAAARIAADA